MSAPVEDPSLLWYEQDLCSAHPNPKRHLFFKLPSYVLAARYLPVFNQMAVLVTWREGIERQNEVEVVIEADRTYTKLADVKNLTKRRF